MTADTPALIPRGHNAVMASRQPTEAGDLDLFPTPPWAARAGGELIKRLDPQARTCWEPAAGLGHMAWGLADYFETVWSSDVHDYGGGFQVVDFLSPGAVIIPAGRERRGPDVDWIVTNPPFKDGQAFAEKAMGRARRGVAMLLRLQFLCAAAREELLFGKHPVTVVAPFVERVPMVKGRWDPKASTATDYAWFVWQFGVPPGPRLEPIRAGARARLTRKTDLERFAAGADGEGLFA